MRITLHQLKVFDTVAKLNSVTQAAHALHMTQPAVSNILRQLESHYDCPLIEVIGRKLSLTPFGAALVEGCRQIEATLCATETEINLLKGGLSGTLKIATVSTAKYFTARLLGQFKNQHAGIHIKLTVCNRHDIMQRLTENLDDFVIMSHPPSSLPVDAAHFYDDELVVAMANQHPTAKTQTPATLTSLKNEAWILREPGSGTRYATENIFQKHKFSPIVEMEISDNEAIKQAIMANMGISIISKQSIETELKHQLITVAKIKGFPAKHTWYLVKNKGKKLPPIAELFYAFAHNDAN